MKKIAKVLVFLILIGIVINITLTRYVAQKSDISSLIGSIWNGGQISTYNYAAIVNNYGYYLSFIEKEEYENAYKFMPYEYRTYKTYDEFVKDVKNTNYSDLKIVDIIRRTENMYSILLSNNTDKTVENIMTFNKNNTSYTITPETFIEYKEINKKIKKKSVEYSLISTSNYLDKFVANIEIKNLSNKEIIEISKIELIQNSVKHIKGDVSSFIINPNEEKNIEVEFKTYIDFPEKLEISRYIEKKDKTYVYTFNIEE